MFDLTPISCNWIDESIFSVSYTEGFHDNDICCLETVTVVRNTREIVPALGWWKSYCTHNQLIIVLILMCVLPQGLTSAGIASSFKESYLVLLCPDNISLLCHRFMAEILPIWRKTLSNQSLLYKILPQCREKVVYHSNYSIHNFIFKFV